MYGEVNNSKDDIWIISKGKITDYNKINICGEIFKGQVKEYYISELGCYLLNPKLVEVAERVTGCEIVYKDSFFNGVRRSFRKVFPFINKISGAIERQSQRVINKNNLYDYRFNDERLKAHLEDLDNMMREYDVVSRFLKNADFDKIHDIKAICEDPSGNLVDINIKGTMNDKVQFIKENLYHNINVSFSRAYLGNGVYELRGFDFTKFNPSKRFKLLKFTTDGEVKCCVFNETGEFLFKVHEDTKIAHPILFEYSLKIDEELRNTVKSCTKGKAQAYKIYFSGKTEFPYSLRYLPGVFRRNINLVTEGNNINLADILNTYQKVVSFCQLSENGKGKKNLFTNISVMHDLAALDELRDYMPDLYTKLESEAMETETGSLYLLDSMSGYKNQRSL